MNKAAMITHEDFINDDQCGYLSFMAQIKINEGRAADLTEEEAEAWLIENTVDATHKPLEGF